MNTKKIDAPLPLTDLLKYIGNQNFDNRSAFNPEYQWRLKSGFILRLFQTCGNQRWVDIEKEYYRLLRGSLPPASQPLAIQKLNKAFEALILRLTEYLSKIEAPVGNKKYWDIMRSPIKPSEISFTKDSEITPERTLLLNFNYTSNANVYARHCKFDLIQIHGSLGDLQNPIIFGYGDEMDKRFSEIEDLNKNEYLQYFKSFGYFKSPNYANMLRFINSDTYQVYIFGMSCGLSDRTMLNMIFEHSNCKSIKVFYHKHAQGDNYTELTMDISRHFTNKGLARKLIVNKQDSLPMPQIQN